MDIYLNHRSWYLIICIGAALIYSIILYFKNLRSNELKKWTILLLAFTRFFIVLMLCLFLLEPVFKKDNIQSEKPILVFAQDNSESILVNKDSIYYRNSYKDSVLNLIDKLENKFDVHTFSFGNSINEGLSFDFIEKATDFGNLFKELNDRYYGRNLGAVIIASDGIINSGSNPLYTDQGIDQAKIYTVPLGDTIYQKDASIQKVLCNKVVSFGNKFPVDVHLLSKKMKGNIIKVSIYNGEELIQTKELLINNELDASTIKFILNADKAGKIKYDVKITETKGEITFVNNYYTYYVDVLDQLQRVLILANAPHPDIAAIKQVISDKFNRKIDVQLINDFDNNIEDYDLIILHRTYFNKNVKISKLIQTSRAAKIPLIHLTGAEINTQFFNELDLGVYIEGHDGIINAMPVINTDFSTFIINKKMKEQINKYPPLSVPFVAVYKKNISTNVMIYQEINGEFTDYPMVLLNEHPEVREALIFGEGIWRWKMNEYLNNKEINVFSSIFSKITQYVTSNDKKDRFSIEVDNDFKENDPIHFYGEIYNRNFELIKDAEIEIDITNDSGNLFKKVMINNGSSYELHINKLPPGNYSYNAKLVYGDEHFQQEGSFNVHKVRLEVLNSRADFSYLNQLANHYNGEGVSKENLNELYQLLIKSNMPSISHHSSKLEDLIKWKWLFFIISSLLFIEWFSRKRSGLY